MAVAENRSFSGTLVLLLLNLWIGQLFGLAAGILCFHGRTGLGTTPLAQLPIAAQVRLIDAVRIGKMVGALMGLILASQGLTFTVRTAVSLSVAMLPIVNAFL